MVRLFLSGRLDLRDGAGGELASILAQPKRLALLARLALASRDGFVRRDALLPLFWPEFDEARARRALSRALYHLRQGLGEGVLTARGAEEVGIDPAALWCDAREMEALLDAGRAEEALGLYRGDLLPGFHVEDAPEWERWLERERTRLRDRARDAAWGLAAAAEERDDVEAATRWTRMALLLTPDDERSLRRLIQLLDRAGDRAGALREYEAFARRMAEEYEVDPAPETVRLVDEVRAREDVPGPAAAPAPSPPRSESTPRSQTGTDVIGGMRGPGSGVSGSGGSTESDGSIEGIGSLGSLGSIGSTASGGSRAAADGEGFGGFGRSGASAGPAARVAGFGGSDESTADAVSSPNRRRWAWIGAASAVVVAGVVAIHVVAARGPAGEGAFGRIRSSVPGTQSVAATRAYVDGERNFGAGRYAEAVEAYRRAIAADSGFALAYHRLSQAADWTGAYQMAAWAAAEGERRAGTLPAADRLHVQAWRAYVGGDAVAAEGLYREVLALDSADVEAWFYLAEVQYHWLPTYGRPAGDSRAAWRNVLAHDPSNVGARIHMARLAAEEGGRAEFERWTRGMEERAVEGDRTLELRVMDAFAFGAMDARRAAAAQLAAADNDVLRQGIVTAAAVTSDDLDGVETLLVPQMIPPTQNPAAEILDYLLGVEVRVARGERRAAEAALDSVRPFHPAWVAEYRGMMASLPFLPSSATERTDLADALLAGKPTPRAIYAAGLLRLRAGDPAGASAAAEALAARGTADPDEAFNGEMIRLLRAEVLRAQGRPGDALAILGAPRGDPSGALPSLRSFPKAHERWLRAELLRETGRPREALRWYETFPDPQGYDLAYRAPAYLRRAEIHRALGETARAKALEARFAILWRRADPGLVSFIRQQSDR